MNAVKNVLGKAHNVVRNITEQNDVESITDFEVVGRGLVHVFNQVVYFIIDLNNDLKNDNVAQQKLAANRTHLYVNETEIQVEKDHLNRVKEDEKKAIFKDVINLDLNSKVLVKITFFLILQLFGMNEKPLKIITDVKIDFIKLENTFKVVINQEVLPIT